MDAAGGQPMVGVTQLRPEPFHGIPGQPRPPVVHRPRDLQGGGRPFGLQVEVCRSIVVRLIEVGGPQRGEFFRVQAPYRALDVQRRRAVGLGDGAYLPRGRDPALPESDVSLADRKGASLEVQRCRTAHEDAIDRPSRVDVDVHPPDIRPDLVHVDDAPPGGEPAAPETDAVDGDVGPSTVLGQLDALDLRDESIQVRGDPADGQDGKPGGSAEQGKEVNTPGQGLCGKDLVPLFGGQEDVLERVAANGASPDPGSG